MSLLVQIAGSALVLLAFLGAQAGRLTPASRLYLWLNLIGSGALAASAVIESQWGFLVLETAWTGASLAGLLRRRPLGGS